MTTESLDRLRAYWAAVTTRASSLADAASAVDNGRTDATSAVTGSVVTTSTADPGTVVATPSAGAQPSTVTHFGGVGGATLSAATGDADTLGRLRAYWATVATAAESTSAAPVATVTTAAPAATATTAAPAAPVDGVDALGRLRAYWAAVATAATPSATADTSGAGAVAVTMVAAPTTSATPTTSAVGSLLVGRPRVVATSPRCANHLDATLWDVRPVPSRPGWFRGTCRRCGRFIGYRPADCSGRSRKRPRRC